MPTPFSEEQEQRRSSDGRDRLPPGQRLVTDWPVLSYGATPSIPTADWRLRASGAVEEEHAWTWEAFLALGQESRVNDIHCVTTWSRYDNTWEGVLFRSVLEQLRVLPEATAVLVHCYGGYTTNIPLADLRRDDHALFAITHDGTPLAPEHGGPMRLVVPSLYFWKSAKWVSGVEFLAQDRPGFWEQYGYNMHGDPWEEERYS